MAENKKVFFPFAPENISGLEPFLKDADVYYTAESEDAAAALEKKLCGICRCVGSCVTSEQTFEKISEAVFEAADILGVINTIVYAPELKADGKVFLDLSADDFTAHTTSLNAIFLICKCALPYMLGTEGSTIAVVLPQEPVNAISQMYNGAISSLADAMNRELASYGVSVNIIQTAK